MSKKKDIEKLSEMFNSLIKEVYDKGYHLEDISESIGIIKMEFDTKHNLQ